MEARNILQYSVFRHSFSFFHSIQTSKYTKWKQIECRVYFHTIKVLEQRIPFNNNNNQ